jgi:hypothetical protein
LGRDDIGLIDFLLTEKEFEFIGLHAEFLFRHRLILSWSQHFRATKSVAKGIAVSRLEK